ncbi:heterokaryon incompatibility protein-domain-containing protein [Xylariaceae sp. FL0255]|nr:heterokaryon incompatibility protein-domain-containing protein [Xylariaceae sp. FL0255]
MWLIHCATLALEEFIARIPPYAILSHTWEREEVTFRHMQDKQAASQMQGFAKINKTCELARSHGYEYAWVDTCCIDKSSSAELSEAINSMFAYYKKARRCYVYLADYTSQKEFWNIAGGVEHSADSDTDSSSSENLLIGKEDISSTRWLKRGWTLQELIAPTNVDFYDQNWSFLGTKLDSAEYLSRITHIPVNILRGDSNCNRISIASRMSWASMRSTTRVEDMAYCLLGIFDVNMPLLYGEGNKAFYRLQEEIIRSSDDRSIFAWKAEPDELEGYRGLLAEDIDEFKSCIGFRSIQNVENGYRAAEYTICNQGLRIHSLLKARPYCSDYLLPVGYSSSSPSSEVAVRLLQYGPSLFIRSSPERYAHLDSASYHIDLPSPQYIALRGQDDLEASALFCRDGSVTLRLPPQLDELVISRVSPPLHWDRLNKIMLRAEASEIAGYYIGELANLGSFVIVCGRSDRYDMEHPEAPFYCSVFSTADPVIKALLTPAIYHNINTELSIAHRAMKELDFPHNVILGHGNESCRVVIQGTKVTKDHGPCVEISFVINVTVEACQN